MFDSLAPLNIYKQSRVVSHDEARAVASGKGALRLFEGYSPHKGQVRLHKLSTRFVAVVAGRRGGKTAALGHEFLKRVFMDYKAWKGAGNVWRKPSRLGGEIKGALQYWLVAPTYRHTLLMLQVIFEILGGLDSPLILSYNKAESRLWLVGGIKIEARSAENPNMLVGDSLNGLWMDEAARVKGEAWGENIKPNLDDNEGWALFSTTPLGQNWFYNEVWQKTQLTSEMSLRDMQFGGVSWTTADNTAVPILAREQALAKLMLPPAVYARNYLASFTAFDGQIFQAFNADSTHVTNAVPWSRIVDRWGGLDWGASNAGCQLELGRDDEGVIWVWSEDYERDLIVAPPSDSIHADCWVNRMKRTRSLRHVSRWWADPSGKGNILTCKREGLDVRPANNDVMAGIDLINAMLQPVPRVAGGQATPSIKIHAKCVNLIREMTSYRWAKDDKPLKKDDHAVDTLRYALLSEHALSRSGSRAKLIDWSIFD